MGEDESVVRAAEPINRIRLKDTPGDGHLSVNTPFRSSISTAASHKEDQSGTRLIPNRLVFNFKRNLLLDTNDMPEHRRNVERTVKMHPGAEVVFSSDEDCRSSIARVHSEHLASFFDKERYGPYKSDICRLSTLYEGGGYYFDNDFEVSQDVRPLLPSNISLSTVLELDSTRNIFQAFLASAPRHPVLKAALDGTFERYIGKSTAYGGWAGPEVFGKALRRWLGRPRFSTGFVRSRGLKKGVYLFEETRDIESYGLSPRRGKGCCCNIVVGDQKQALGWSRFVGAGTFCQKE